MKGDFSKLPFDPKKRHSRVYLQQGRVQLDSDFNELVDLVTHARRQALVDLIGPHGGPATGAGFEITLTQQLYFDGKKTALYWSSWKEAYFPTGDIFTLEMRLLPAADLQHSGTLLSCLNEQGYYLQIESTGHVFFNYVSLDASGKNLVENGFRSNQTLAADVVSHIALVYDGKRLVLFINGFQDASMELAFKPLQSLSYPVIVGALNRDGERVDYYQGVLEELRFWRVMRSQRLLLVDMFKELKVGVEGLVGLVPLSGTNNQEVIDLYSGKVGVLDDSGKPPWKPDLRIGKGRYYVGGICCENFSETSFSRQADLPNVLLPDDFNKPGKWLVYLSVWERMVNALEDPSLAEVALNGIDTSVRTRAVQQVRIMPVTQVKGPDAWREWRELLTSENSRGLMTAFRKSTSQTLDNQLYRVEVHCGGGIYGPIGRERDDSNSLAMRMIQARRFVFDKADLGRLPEVGQLVEYYSDLSDRQHARGLLLVVKERGENWLGFGRDIEATDISDKPRIRSIAGLKWSSDNGSLTWPVRSLETLSEDEGAIQLVDAGRAAQRLIPGAWVELVHTDQQLQERLPCLVKVSRIDEATRLIIKPLPHDWQQFNRSGLRLVLWDQPGYDLEAGMTGSETDPNKENNSGILPATTMALPLEKGIEIYFERRGSLRIGDYWNITARTRLDQGIEWPTDRQGKPLPQEPHGCRHSFAPLALILRDSSKVQLKDMRHLFTPLTRASDLAADPDEEKNQTQKPTPEPKPASQPQPTPQAQAPELPAGFSLLSAQAVSPAGFHRTGLTIKAQPWTQFAGPPLRDQSSHLVACILFDAVLFAFYHSGEVWRFEPGLEKWSSCKWIPTPRDGFGAALMSGRIHIVGGCDSAGERLDRHEIYDPRLDQWIEAASMPTARDKISLCACMGVLFAMGGETRSGGFLSGASTLNEIYDPGTESWHSGAPLTAARLQASLVTLDDRLHLIGGYLRHRLKLRALTPTPMHEVYHPDTGQWVRLADLPEGVCPVQAAVGRRTIHLLGGSSSSTHTRHLVYDAARNLYREADALPDSPCPRLMAGDDQRFFLLDCANSGMLHQYIRDSLLYVHCKN